jgi:hypothetical protein
LGARPNLNVATLYWLQSRKQPRFPLALRSKHLMRAVSLRRELGNVPIVQVCAGFAVQLRAALKNQMLNVEGMLSKALLGRASILASLQGVQILNLITARVLPVGLALALFTSCQKAETEIAPGQNLIDRPGEYRVRGEQIHIRARVEEGMVQYEVIKNGMPIIKSTERASHTQRWFLCWDDQQRLWFESSDIGGLMWTTNSGGTYFPKSTDDPKVIKSMPLIVFDGLPSSLRARFKHLRTP